MHAAPAEVPPGPGVPGRYPPATLLADGGRAAGGLLATLGPLVMVEPHPVVAVALAAMVAVFGLFGGRTLVRCFTRIQLEEDHLAVDGPWRRRLDWRQLEALRLTYWSTRRDRRGGWMQLELRAPGVRVGLESTLTGFEGILARAARAARDNRLTLDAATRENLLDQGHAVPSATS